MAYPSDVTAPGSVFAANIGRLKLLMNELRIGSDKVNEQVDNATARLLADHQTAESLLSAMSEVTPTIADLQSSIDTRLFSGPWMVVMVVTFTEAYVEDALGLLIRNAFGQSTVPSAIVDEVSARWIKNTLRSGGPHQWISQLKKFGASGYADDLGKRMQKIWDLRHQIVHTAEPAIQGNPYAVLKEALSVIGDFVLITDAFVVTNSA